MKGTFRRTEKGRTLTTRGYINFLHLFGRIMPVKLKLSKTVSGKPRPPALANHFLVFVEPGGGDYVSGYTLETMNQIAGE